MSDFCENLEREIRAKFQEVFEDRTFTRVALRLQEKWWTSQEGKDSWEKWEWGKKAKLPEKWWQE